MKFATAAVLFPVATSALAIRQDGWTAYDQETDVLKADGLCRAYTTTDKDDRASGLGMCDDTCAAARDITPDDAVFSVSCIGATGSGAPETSDPSGATYYLGECKCNNPLVNWAVESIVVEGLPAVGRVTCATWKLAAVEAAKLIAGTPTSLGSAVQTLVKVAKIVGTVEKGRNKYEEWVKEVSADEGACDFSPGQLYDDFIGISEEDLALVF